MIATRLSVSVRLTRQAVHPGGSHVGSPRLSISSVIRLDSVAVASASATRLLYRRAAPATRLSLLRVQMACRGGAGPRHGTPERPVGSGSGDEAELAEGGHAVVQADLLGDAAVFHLQDGDAGEPHHLAGAGRQRADGHVVERRTGVGAAAFPLADHVVALGDEVGGAPEVQVRE